MRIWRFAVMSVFVGLAIIVLHGASQHVGLLGNSFPVTGNIDPMSLPLLTESPFVYDHQFQVPPDQRLEFTDFTMAPAYNPANNSLFMTNRDSNVVEISIPDTAHDNAVADTLQPATNIAPGLFGNAGGFIPGALNMVLISGMLVVNNQLIITGASFYDSGQINTFLRKPTLNLSVHDITDPQPPDVTLPIRPGYVNGNMMAIPPNWQAALGGSYTVSANAAAIVGGRSWGMSLFTFDPLSLGVVSPVTVNPLVYYPPAHEMASHGPGGPDTDPSTWGWFFTDNTVFSPSTGDFNQRFPDGSFTPDTSGYGNGIHAGAVSSWWDQGTDTFLSGLMTPNHRTVMFFERQGSGHFCYGNPDDTGAQCVDPADDAIDPATGFGFRGGGSHGGHTYPYRFRILAYDANDLIAVKNHTKQPWEPIPYAVWLLDMDGWEAGDAGQHFPLGAAYDPATGRLWLLDKQRAAGGLPRVFEFHLAPGA